MTAAEESAGAKAAKAKRDEFIALLRDIFRMDCADLDFGVYRIMKMKAAAIEERLIAGADTLITDALGEEQTATRKRLQAALSAAEDAVRKHLGGKALNAEKQLRDPFHETPHGEHYLQAQKRAAATLAMPEAEAGLFNHLLRFFRRYYNDGDFMPTRRNAARGCYTIAHNGEDVMLHWANRGQYYIKSALQFSAYAFAAGSVRARFVVRSARDMPKDNNKGGNRLFFPRMADAVFNNAEVEIPLEYRPPMESDNLQGKNGEQQKTIICRAQKDATAIIAKKPKFAKLIEPQKDESNPAAAPESPLQTHLRRYARGNERDFFVHKDLGGFLSRELDAYIKNEVMDITALEDDEGGLTRQYLAAKVLKHGGGVIISFLAQFENLQKTLWQKRKFITATNYIARLGAIKDDAARASISTIIIANDNQWREWQKLNLLGDKAETLLGNNNKEARMKFLQNYPSLPVDTAHFDDAFVLQLLAAFGDIDDNTDGVLIKGDNYQALNLLGEKYRNKIKCIYIDPPYNTDQSKIMYKNEYEHSSWLTMMENRLALTPAFLTDDAVVMTAIDDYEMNRLCELKQVCFPDCERHVIVINHHPQGAGMGGAKLSRTHEYMIVMTRPNAPQLKGCRIDEQIERRSFRRAGQGENNFRGDFSNSFFALLVNADRKVVDIELPPEGNDYPRENTPEGYRRIYPLGEDGSERVWRHAYETTRKIVAEGMLECTSQFVIRHIIDHGENRRAALFSNWTAEKYNAGTSGANLLGDIIGSAGAFSYPKSIHTVKDAIDSCTWDDHNAIIMDYFAGSGTTAHAVINLNREDGGRRKFILAEMGGHFDNVILPRIKKLIFARQWKDGKPQNNNGEMPSAGEPRLIKYHQMESYEDALDNILFDEEERGIFGEKYQNYQARYMLQWESKQCATFANSEHLDSPFDYALRRAGEQNPMLADLPETFCYLAAMHLITRRQCKRKAGNKTINYQMDYGIIQGKPALVVWRNTTNWTKADYDADAKFITTLPEAKTAVTIYANGATAAENIKSLTPLFHQKMFPPAK